MSPKTRIQVALLSPSEIRRRALLGADWFIHTQTVSRKPAWDANHGRVPYNVHLPSGTVVGGLSWSQGRAIMCLLGAWELSGGKPAYLEAAVRCGTYLCQALQVMDARDPRSFGAFREEVPASRFCYPRDAIEAAFGLLLLHVATGEKDYLERCTIFADWYLTQAVDASANWPRGTVDFDDPSRDPHALRFFQAGGAPFFWHLYTITGTKRYVTSGVRMMADGLLERFIDPVSGAIRSPAADAHHATKQGEVPVAINDDGASIALSCAYRALGPARGTKYLEAARRYGQWLMTSCPRPIPLWAAPGLHVVALTEIAALTGDAACTAFASQLMAEHVRNQVMAPDRLDRHGAFRGEDEPADWYFKGGKGKDFLTTRSTAYGTLGLLRLAGIVGPAYSATGLDRFTAFARRK